MKGAFAGFPPRARSTPVPDLFFSQVLPQVQDQAELKVVLHILWCLFRKQGLPRYVTRRELEADPVLRASLGGGRTAGELEAGLELATERGLLLRLRLDLNGRREEAYVVNDAPGRRTLEGLEARAAEGGWVVPPEEPPPERPNIFALYENVFGTLTLPLVEELREAEAQYPEEWIAEAFQQAAEARAHDWRYVRSVLERWEREGKDSGAPGGAAQKKVGRYVQGRRGPLVPWR